MGFADKIVEELIGHIKEEDSVLIETSGQVQQVAKMFVSDVPKIDPNLFVNGTEPNVRFRGYLRQKAETHTRMVSLLTSMRAIDGYKDLDARKFFRGYRSCRPYLEESRLILRVFSIKVLLDVGDNQEIAEIAQSLLPQQLHEPPNAAAYEGFVGELSLKGAFKFPTFAGTVQEAYEALFVPHYLFPFLTPLEQAGKARFLDVAERAYNKAKGKAA